MFSKSGCPYCEAAKKWFEKNNLTLEVVVIDDEAERKAWYATQGEDVKTMPQIFLDDERIGGYNDLIARESEILSKLKIDFTGEEDF